MTLLDAYALVALLADEPAAGEVEKLLRERCSVTTVNLAEALDVLQRGYGVEEDILRTGLDPLLRSRLAVHDSDAEDAWLAGSLRSRYYDRRSCAISVADCLLLAAAQGSSSAVATSDPAVAAVARHEGIGLVPLADRQGVLP